MRTGRPKAPLTWNREERRELESLAHRSRSVPALARRARIVLACAEGQDNKGVAHRLRATPATVGKWRTRFVWERLAGLYDEPRPGAPRTITDEEIEQVVVRTLESTPRGATHWSTRGMAQAAGLSHATISRIWHAFGLQPHRSETFKLSPDPLLGAEGARYRGVVRQPAGARRGALRGREVADSSAGSRRCCRCGPASPSGGRPTTSAMAPPRRFPRSTARAAKRSAPRIAAIGPSSAASSWTASPAAAP